MLQLPKSDEKCLEVYEALNRIAEYIELNQTELFNLKCNVINKLKNQKKNHLTDDELFELLSSIF